MRNYCTCYFSYLQIYNDPYPTGLTEGWYIGLSQSAAHDLAVAAGAPFIPGFSHVNVFDLGKQYFLLNRETIVGAISGAVFPGVSTAADTLGLTGGCLYNSFNNLYVAEGFTPGESPKHSRKWPTSDGARFRAKKGKAGTQEMSLLTYLEQLLFTWQSGISVGVQQQIPQRWLEALETVILHYETGKVTPTQVYAWLNGIDLSAKATTI